LLFLNFGWLFIPRVHLYASEPSVNYRWLYNKIGLEIIKEKMLGVGIGNQLFYAINNNLYQKFGIFSQKDWQPIHNIYLLIAAEIGVVGLVLFGLLIVCLLFKRLKAWLKEIEVEDLTATMIFLSLLLFGLVDHFSWTLQAGRLMFWLIIALVLAFSLRNNSLESS
jgi:O-antigen ligase